jgi:carboxymethylenebutenolidase
MKYSALILSLVFALGACNTHSDSYTDAMAHEHTGDSPTTNEVATMEPSQPISGEWVTYGTIDGKELKGYLSMPAGATGPLPALIVIHEWWGLNDNIKQMTDLLAGEGYMALAVDFYDGRVATTPDSAQTYMRSVMGNMDSGRQLVTAAANWLKNDRQAPKLGVMGWCFGGAWSLNTSLTVPSMIDATVIYYGNLNTNPADLAKLDMPILGIFGADDRAIPVASVNRFETVLDSLGKSVDIHIYEGADHAFANPSGGRYKADAAADAWEKTLAFLSAHLR